MRAHVVNQDGHCPEVVNRTIEEALFLRSVQVNTHDAIRTCRLVQIGNKASRNRFAPQVFLILARVGVIGSDCGNTLGRCSLRCIDHQELFHQPFIHFTGMRLQDEDIRTTY